MSASNLPDRVEEAQVITEDMLAEGPVKDAPGQFEKSMSYFPRFSLMLIAINVIMFILELSTGALASREALIEAGALVRDNVLAGEWWRLISAAFLHGDFWHLVSNMVMLYVLGMASEHAFGSRRFLTVYFVAALSGSVVSLIMSPGPSVGASGAIFGLFGVICVFFVKHRSKLLLRDKETGIVAGIMAVYQIFRGWGSPQIDNFAHLGGLIGGVIAALVISPRFFDKEQ